MFDFPSELNEYLFSFFPKASLVSCAKVSRSGNELAKAALIETNKETLLKQMAPFEIGRKELMKFARRHPKMAMMAIDIDAKRTKYLLLREDLVNLACMHIDVARHILTNQVLQAHGRLKFASVICHTYPELAYLVFSSTLPRPKPDEMVSIIQKHPFLFKQLIEYRKFINLIDKSRILVKLGLINQEIAVFILNNSEKFKGFSVYWHGTHFGLQHQEVAIELLNNPKYKELFQDDAILIEQFGKKHSEAARIILSNEDLCSSLNREQRENLASEIEERRFSHS